MISVLLPVYNNRATLGPALDSLAWQSYRDFEVVLVDDGSQDGSLELAQARARRDCRVRVLACPHRGLVETLNTGLAACRFPLVARMDADDLSHPQRLACQAAYLAAHQELALVGSRVRVFPQSSLGSGFRRYQDWQNQLLSSEQIERDMLVESPLVHPSVMVRKAWYERVGGYRDPGWPEDYDLWLRLWLAGARAAKVDRTLLFWREHAARLTRTHPAYRAEAIRACKVDACLQRYPIPSAGVVIWGAGDDGKRLARHFRRRGVTVAAFSDLRRGRIGQRIDGSLVVNPRDWAPVGEPDEARDGYLRGCFHVAAVGKVGGRELVRQELRDWGLRELRDFVCLA